jgi:hypothetical protein
LALRDLLPPGTYSMCRIRSASSSCRLLISLREYRGAGSLRRRGWLN